MNNKNTPKQLSRRSKAIIIFAIIYMPFSFGRFFLEYKCSFIDCKPASWSKIQEIVIDNAKLLGTESHLVNIHVSVVGRTELTENDLPAVFEFRIYYQNNENDDVVQFDDKNLWIQKRSSGRNYHLLYSEELLERFKRVRLGPRDIYELTWRQADIILNHPIESVSMILSTEDDAQKRFSVESYWFVIYLDDEDSISYWIDAQNGEIVDTR